MPNSSTLPTFHVPVDEMKVIGAGRAYTLYSLQTPAGPREMLARNSGNYQAAKLLLLCVTEDVKLVEPTNASSPFERLVQTVVLTGVHEFKSLLLASYRPITQFPTMPFRTLYQYELPGGVLEFGEGNLEGALREGMEEAGIAQKNQIVQAAPILDPPCPFDAGAHAEIYGIQVAIMQGFPKPPRREGIIPDYCETIPLPYALDYLLRKRKSHYCVEGYAVLAHIIMNHAITLASLGQKLAGQSLVLSGLS